MTSPLIRKASFLLNVDWGRNLAREQILRARNCNDLERLAPALRGFNQQIVRTAVILFLAEMLRPTSFVETGTYLGQTAIAARDLLRVPVFTVENKLTHFVAALLIRARVGRIGGITNQLGDSPEFLRRLIDSQRLGPRPFFYLDAHWDDYLPLADELEIVLKSLSWAVVIVDDFQVPGRPDLGFDTYRGTPLGMEVIRRSLTQEVRIFFPDHEALWESGHRRGTLLLTHGAELPPDIKGLGFPFSLLREFRRDGGRLAG